MPSRPYITCVYAYSVDVFTPRNSLENLVLTDDNGVPLTTDGVGDFDPVDFSSGDFAASGIGGAVEFLTA